ncbi:hypothetical protein PpBr36_00658 [Pyricularia pennisetigena]|uniref:hypothetical protein n=1 Tax=Pyricularia pennisetigena TaxID=1578925 RepID=UPI00114F6712|nr:hypothetical protein PpBr36_00658 [Pyricularia pennisetigena]TLS28494.1 hypothetical protein PpBr36_00658 [Pyricularia pennisetigena]
MAISSDGMERGWFSACVWSLVTVVRNVVHGHQFMSGVQFGGSGCCPPELPPRVMPLKDGEGSEPKLLPPCSGSSHATFMSRSSQMP